MPITSVFITHAGASNSGSSVLATCTINHAATRYSPAIETAIEFYFEDNRIVPSPSKARSGQDVIELPASLSAKVLLLNEMLAQHVTAAELARRLKTTPQSVQRIMDLNHATKIDTVADAFRALGKRLDFRVKRNIQTV